MIIDKIEWINVETKHHKETTTKNTHKHHEIWKCFQW
jgi:hypothetical protein